MDPWSDAGGSVEPANEAGPSWSGNKESEDERTNTKSTSSPTFHTSTSVDPWAENSAPIGFNIPSTSYSTNEKRSSVEYGNDDGENSRNDFDPWGGGSVPMTTSLSAHDNIYLNRQVEDKGNEEEEEEEERRDFGWQESNDDRELAIKVENEMHIANHEEEQQERHTETFDEDDPWGSGAQARRAKAEANAQREEIIRLQEEAKGRSSMQEEERNHETEADQENKDVKDVKKSDDKEKIETATSSTAAPATTGGWRSFFTRASAPAEPNNTSRAPSGSDNVEIDKSTTPRGSTEIKSVQKDNTIAAPRLWQAPTLRTAHNRTGSNGTQGSGAKETGPASATSPSDQGPGWEVKTKKQAAPSGGFIQGLLGSGQNKEGSALSRLGNPLQRPPVVSAQDVDDDDSGDIEETGLEWDAGDSFESSSKAKQTKPPPDLLSNDIPQESAVSRLFGRFRGKATPGQEDGKQQEDDLSWLENIGEGKSTTSQKPEGDGLDNDDWLAFVESKPGNGNGQSGSANIRQIPKAGESFVIPNLAKLSSPKKQPSPLGPPPRIGAPPSHANTSRPIGSTQYPATTTSPDPDETFGSFKDVTTLAPNSGASYRDEPDSYDDALLKNNGQERQRKKANFLTSFSAGGRPMKPYTFDDDEEEEVRDNSWSAFRDVPYDDAGANQFKGTRESTLPPRSVRPTQQQQQQQQPQPVVRSNSGAKYNQSGILPPPPFNQQRSMNATSLQPTSRTSTPTPIVPSNTKPQTLSKGNTLTNDDLSFFENL